MLPLLLYPNGNRSFQTGCGLDVVAVLSGNRCPPRPFLCQCDRVLHVSSAEAG